MKKLIKNGQHGFTLIELMIVVAIIGILAAVAIPKFADMLRKSKEGATKGSLTNLRSALTIYISDNEGLTMSASNLPDITAVIIPKYMDVIPTAKLGTYHADVPNSGNAQNILITDTYSRTLSLTQARLWYGTAETNGWIYTSLSGGGWWINCTHTDTKNSEITNW